MAHAHQTTHRRVLAAPPPQIHMDLTPRKPKPNPSAAPPPIIHPPQDPTVASSTIQSISHRFSKLYINHKKTKPQPDPNPHPSFDTSCTTLTKSSSQHGRSGTEKFVDKKINKDDLKKEPSEKSYFDGGDVKKGSKNEEKVKGFGEGGGMRDGRTVNGGRRRRRSFCSSQHELDDFFSCSGVKVVAVDMPPFMQIHAVNCARKAHDSLEKFTSKTLAFALKKEFDGVYGPAWHCIVGTSFGSFVTHSVGGFMYFSMDQKLYILLFKTAVQRAE